MRLCAPSAVVALAVAVASTAVSADPAVVDLELVLAVDVSRSMDVEEQRLQRLGYVNAFRHPEVIQAITSGARGRIAVTYVEWAGVSSQWVTVPWQIVASADDAAAFSDKIAAAPPRAYTGTSISSSLFFAATQFQKSGALGDRRAIDVSGDGPNNMGIPVDQTRDWVVRQGITINGLPIMLRPGGDSPFGLPNLDVYYEDCVIGGPGAFMITIEDVSRFEVAIRRKLVLEIAGLPAHVLRAEYVRPPRIDCLIGEKSRRGRQFQFER